VNRNLINLELLCVQITRGHKQHWTTERRRCIAG